MESPNSVPFARVWYGIDGYVQESGNFAPKAPVSNGLMFARRQGGGATFRPPPVTRLGICEYAGGASLLTRLLFLLERGVSVLFLALTMRLFGRLPFCLFLFFMWYWMLYMTRTVHPPLTNGGAVQSLGVLVSTVSVLGHDSGGPNAVYALTAG